MQCARRAGVIALAALMLAGQSLARAATPESMMVPQEQMRLKFQDGSGHFS